jgi:hypothetical protein
MKGNRAIGFNVMLDKVWKILSTRDKGIKILIGLMIIRVTRSSGKR